MPSNNLYTILCNYAAHNVNKPVRTNSEISLYNDLLYKSEISNN